MKSRKPIFGYRMMAFSLLAIVLLGFTVWAHHMFVSGMQSWIRIPMMVTTAIIAVPTGIKIFSWLATLWRGVLHLDTPMLFALGFLTMFTLGGISGVMLAMVPLDIHVERHVLHRRPHPLRALRRLAVHDLRRRLLLVPEDDGPDVRRAARQAALLADVRRSSTLTFAPMHLIGVQGMPRRVADYAEQFAGWNLFISIALVRARPLDAGLPLQHGRVAGAAARARRPTRGARSRSSGRSPRRRRSSTSTRCPTVVGGPYEYGVPGAVHGIFKPAPRRCRSRAGGRARQRRATEPGGASA